MGGQTLQWEECAPVVKAAARKYRGYRALVLDQDDLEQEGAIVALSCIEAFDPQRVQADRRAQLRRALRNKMVKLRDRAYAARRTPQDVFGRALHPLSFDALTSTDEDDLPRWYRSTAAPAVEDRLEERIGAREIVDQLRAELPADDWDLLVETFVEGAHEARALRRWKPRGKVRLGAEQRLSLAVAHATVILSRICYPVEKGEGDMDFLTALYANVEPSRLPPCHPDGADPLGYDKDETSCHNCPDKFRCLPKTIATGLAETQLEDDLEVKTVVSHNGDFASAQREHGRAIERMKRRLAITKAANARGVPPLIPAELLTTRWTASQQPRPAPTISPAEVAQAHAKVVAVPVATPKPKKKRLKRPKKPPAPQPGERGVMKNGKLLPPVRQLTGSKMLKAISQIKIGQPFPLELGMAIVRKMRKGDLVVTLRPTGFEWNGTVYSSLSTAAMYAERRVVSANAFFNLERHKCTQVWDIKGKVIAGEGAHLQP